MKEFRITFLILLLLIPSLTYCVKLIFKNESDYTIEFNAHIGSRDGKKVKFYIQTEKGGAMTSKLMPNKNITLEFEDGKIDENDVFFLKIISPLKSQNIRDVFGKYSLTILFRNIVQFEHQTRAIL